MYGKIVQIMECKNMRAVYHGEGEASAMFYSTPVIAWGLTDKGKVVPLIFDNSGQMLCNALEVGNYVGMLQSWKHRWRRLDEAEEMAVLDDFPCLNPVLKNKKKVVEGEGWSK